MGRKGDLAKKGKEGVWAWVWACAGRGGGVRGER